MRGSWAREDFWRRVKRHLLLSIGFGAILFIGLSVWGEVGEVGRAVAAFRWWYLPLVLLLALGNYFTRFVRWHYYLKSLQIRVRLRQSLAIFLSGLTLSITPGKLGELLKSYLLQQAAETPISKSVPAVVSERLTDVVAIIFLSCAGAAVFGRGGGVLLVSFLITAIFLGIISSRRICEPILSRLGSMRQLSAAAGGLETAYGSMRELSSAPKLLAGTGIGLVSWFFECFGFYLVLGGLGDPTSLFAATFIYALSTIAGAITMLPGGLGATEGSMTGLLILMGAGKSIAVPATLLIRACTLWFAVLVGAGFMLSLGRELGKLPAKA